MDYIELFDRYMADELSPDERMEFDRRLQADAAFREDFGLYASVVRGVRQEGRQDAFDFGHAMKALTREEFYRQSVPRRHVMPCSDAANGYGKRYRRQPSLPPLPLSVSATV